jgi:uncharacterized protein with PIN domain
MSSAPCNECGEQLDDLQCHHHHTSVQVDPHTDDEYVTCDDCPAYWPVVNEVPC